MDKKDAFNIELMDILKTIRRRIKILIIITIPAIIISIYFYSIQKEIPYYQVTTRLIIGNSIDSKGNSFKIEDIASYQKYMKTYEVILSSDLVLEKTVSKLQFKVLPDNIRYSMQTLPQPDTQFMDVKLVWGNSEQAAEILKVLSDVFVEEAKSIYPTCNIKVMDKIKEPRMVLPSKKKTYLYLGPIAGLVISLLIIFGLDFMDNTLNTEEEVEHYLGCAILGTITKDKKKEQIINSQNINSLKHSSLEAYRALRTNIGFSSIYKNVKAIAVISARPAEGKTTTASMLAVVMALAGRKTILVDCDFRKPSIHKLFTRTNKVGITNILLGEVKMEEAIQQSDIDKLHILTVGTKPPNPSEIIASESMRFLIESLKEEYQYIIIDTSPVNLVTDAQMLAQYSDGCLLVVSSGESIIAEAIKAKGLIEQVSGRIIGVVINKLRETDHYKGYYENYEDSNETNKSYRVDSKRKKLRTRTVRQGYLDQSKNV